MGAYSVFFRKSVRRDLAGIPKLDLRRIMERIAALTSDPRPPGCEKLSAQERYRVRPGNYRIVYSIQDQESTVWVVRADRRKRETLRTFEATDAGRDLIVCKDADDLFRKLRV